MLLDQVAPRSKHRKTLQSPLTTLVESNRLAPVIGVTVPQKVVQRVDRKERILRRAGRPRRGGLMLDRGAVRTGALQTPQRPGVGSVFIGVQREDITVSHHPDHLTDKLRHGLLDRLRIRTPQAGLEFCPAQTLRGGHAPLPSQGTIVEEVDEPHA
jgi:hypothetical protein